MKTYELDSIAQEMRVSIVEMLECAKSGHPGGSLSAIDILTVLFFHEMKGISFNSLQEERDRFILSKGHAVPALYAIFAKLGFIQQEELKTLRQLGSRLQGHPDRVRLPLVEASTGSLGQGLSVAQGMALSFKMDKKPTSVFCLMGDGEIQEGQIWEAALSAPKFKLTRLCAILDWNNGQIDGPVSEVMPLEPLADKWKAFGWNVITVDGHNFDELIHAFSQFRSEETQKSLKPTLILAKTVKGKGVSFMEHQIGWHGIAPSKDDAKKAIEEIKKRGMIS